MQAPLISHIGIPKRVDELNKLLEKEKQKIKLSGLIGSAYSVFASATVREITKPHLFIFTDKEAATYFINDLEILLQKKVFFFPCSYRRPYHVEETDNSNVLQIAINCIAIKSFSNLLEEFNIDLPFSLKYFSGKIVS